VTGDGWFVYNLATNLAQMQGPNTAANPASAHVIAEDFCQSHRQPAAQ
jgi:hypothetical protein